MFNQRLVANNATEHTAVQIVRYKSESDVLEQKYPKFDAAKEGPPGAQSWALVHFAERASVEKVRVPGIIGGCHVRTARHARARMLLEVLSSRDSVPLRQRGATISTYISCGPQALAAAAEVPNKKYRELDLKNFPLSSTPSPAGDGDGAAVGGSGSDSGKWSILRRDGVSRVLFLDGSVEIYGVALAASINIVGSCIDATDRSH